MSGERKALASSAVEFSYRLVAENAPAEATVDNLVIGLAVQESKTSATPFKIDLAPQFDPVKARWKKVFDEEFDGDRVDTGKWYFSPTSEKDYAKVHDGLLEIVCNWATPDKTKTKSASLYSNEVFGHGYFEARVKFRQQSGWWSAFWLCTHGPSNPFLDGWEIDIYEDYYMGPKKPGEEPRGLLDHNLHVFACGTLRSWNYGSKLPGKVDDWYVVACKWTPFEVSYYLNGKLIQSEASHSPHSSVTFDPFNHAAGYVPLHAILSGCCGKSGGDPTKGKFPESFLRRLRADLRISARFRPGCQTGQEARRIHLYPQTRRRTAFQGAGGTVGKDRREDQAGLPVRQRRAAGLSIRAAL